MEQTSRDFPGPAVYLTNSPRGGVTSFLANSRKIFARAGFERGDGCDDV
jgi:hypothetical protein